MCIVSDKWISTKENSNEIKNNKIDNRTEGKNSCHAITLYFSINYLSLISI